MGLRRLAVGGLLLAAGFAVATPVDATGPIRPAVEALATVDELPAGFQPAPLGQEPTDLCGRRFAALLTPRTSVGRLYLAAPDDGTVASVEEDLLSFAPGDGARFMALLRRQPPCPASGVGRADGMAVQGAVQPLTLRGLEGDVSALTIRGPASGRPLRDPGSRVDQLVVRHGDYIGVLTYASYGFFFDEGVRNRLAQELSDRLGALG